MHSSYYTASQKIHSLEDLQTESIDFSLIYCGKEQCEPEYCYGPNCRENYVLHMILDGRGVLETGGSVFPLERDDAFILFPNVEAYYRADKDKPWTYMWVGFDGVMAYETMRNAGFSKNMPVKTFDHRLVETLETHIENMLAASQLTFSNALKRNSYLMQLFADLAEANEQRNSAQIGLDSAHSVYVKHAMDYITHHFSERIRINELAAYIGVNRSYLTTIFKRVLGVSPQEFLVNLRVEKASSLLQNTSIPISNIAELVGYDDSLAFSKIFKKYTGVSPQQFRASPSELVILHNDAETPEQPQ